MEKVARIDGPSQTASQLDADAIKPRLHRSRIFPRDPDFAAKAVRPDEYVISADETSQLSVLHRRRLGCWAGTHPPGGVVEFEDRRGGTLTYLAALDGHHANSGRSGFVVRTGHGLQNAPATSAIRSVLVY